MSNGPLFTDAFLPQSLKWISSVSKLIERDLYAPRLPLLETSQLCEFLLQWGNSTNVNVIFLVDSTYDISNSLQCHSRKLTSLDNLHFRCVHFTDEPTSLTVAPVGEVFFCSSVLCNVVNDKRRGINHLNKEDRVKDSPGMEKTPLMQRCMRLLLFKSPIFLCLLWNVMCQILIKIGGSFCGKIL